MAVFSRKIDFDPRAKFIILAMINIMVFTKHESYIDWICVGLILALFLCMGMAFQAMLGLLFYGFLTGALHLCTLFSGIFSAFGSFTIIHIQKIFPVFLFASGFIKTTKISHLMCAMQKLHLPKYIVIPFSVAMRFFPAARDDFSRIKDAMRLRGVAFSLSNILRHPFTVFEYALLPMMLRCANIAEELSAAAVARGIETNRPRTSIWELRFSWLDFFITSLFAALALFTIIKAFING
jgi:energy-coupling factor transport system permease protein